MREVSDCRLCWFLRGVMAGVLVVTVILAITGGLRVRFSVDRVHRCEQCRRPLDAVDRAADRGWRLDDEGAWLCASCVGSEMSARDDLSLYVHGDRVCVHACTGCDGDHHWLEAGSPDYSDDSDYFDRGALPEPGAPILECKHCDAWAVAPDWWGDDEDAEFTIILATPVDGEREGADGG